jgi:hypothetical protein
MRFDDAIIRFEHHRATCTICRNATLYPDEIGNRTALCDDGFQLWKLRRVAALEILNGK